MASRFVREIENLIGTFRWSKSTNIDSIRRVVARTSTCSLQAIGSGGSLTASHMLATLHRRYAGNVANVSTPLEAIGEPLSTNFSTWLLSAGGSNVDILSAARVLIAREPSQLAVLCGRRASLLADLCRKHPFVDLMTYVPPKGKDGFLATNSLLAFTALLTRAYAKEFNRAEDWDEVVDCLEPILRCDSPEVCTWQENIETVCRKPTTVVLYGVASRIGAIDLESKFTESALGNVQVADYRNFAHGRHHWLAKHGCTSSVLAFISEEDRKIAERTLDLIPTEIPQARINLLGGPIATAIASLVAALRITQWFGAARGIDPGKPGVPEFGRRIYRLRMPHTSHIAAPKSGRDYSAIVRKAASSPHVVEHSSELVCWSQSLTMFVERLKNSRFGALVLDYDGTLVDTRDRDSPPSAEMCAELIRLADSGVRIGIATGRGKSVRLALQKCLPNTIWSLILIGYYNGAEVATLDNDDVPDNSSLIHSSLQPIVNSLSNHPAVKDFVNQKNRRYQISLTPFNPGGVQFLWQLVHDAVMQIGADRITVVSSGHSVDVLAPAASKTKVVQAMRNSIGANRILAIGDKGRWPGNDHELLREPYSLSVDEVNTDPATCWNLGRPGQRGVTVTLDYLTQLSARQGYCEFTRDLI